MKCRKTTDLFDDICNHVEVGSEIVIDGIQNRYPQEDSVGVRQGSVREFMGGADYARDSTGSKICRSADSGAAQHQTRKDRRYARADSDSGTVRTTAVNE